MGLTDNTHKCTIAIVGGGYTGAMLSAQLLRLSATDVSIVLIERAAQPGRGVAYGTNVEGHLLNVRADDMSAYPDAPDHFVKWAQRNYSALVRPEDFLPRPLFGQYIVEQLSSARASYPGALRHVQDEAVSIVETSAGGEVHLASGQVITANKVVLALGHFPPANLSFLGDINHSPRFSANPWAPIPSDVTKDKNILLIGSGLTSVDTVIELRSRGFKGVIHIVSRHGLLPQSHKCYVPFPLFWNESSPRTARGLLREVRRQIAIAEFSGSDWRAVIDSLRPVTQKVWLSLPLAEQHRFLRHLRTYWDVHRHRIAERIDEQLSAGMQAGTIRTYVGRISGYREDARGLEVTYRDRQTRETVTLRVDRVVNCTGPDGDLRRVGSPLLCDLIERGMIRQDSHSLGLDVADDGAVRDANGEASDLLYTLGPLRKGVLWESIAVPELRVQLSELADLLLTACRAKNTEQIYATESL